MGSLSYLFNYSVSNRANATPDALIGQALPGISDDAAGMEGSGRRKASELIANRPVVYY